MSSINRDGVAETPAYYTEGDMLFKNSFDAKYDWAGQRRWSGGEGGVTTGAEYHMAYNHKRERTARSTRNNGSSWSANAIQYVYDEASHLIGEYKSNGTPIVEYVWKGDVPVAAIYGTVAAPKIYYIVTDAQNTPRRLVDSSTDAVVWAWDSTAFGVAPPSIETVKFNLRFPGQYYDELTKQHYNLNRYYNPEIGRYMEADPIGLKGGLNPYAYAGSNPVMNVDPSGLDLESMNDTDLSNYQWSSINQQALNSAINSVVYQGFTQRNTMLLLDDNSLGNIYAQGGHVSFFGKETKMYQSAMSTKVPSNLNLITGHGGPDQFWSGALPNEKGYKGTEGPITPQQAYNIAINTPGYDQSQPTWFGACALAGGWCQTYANISGQPALCYDKYVWYNNKNGITGSWEPKYGQDGKAFPNIQNPGKLHIYLPQK